MKFQYQQALSDGYTDQEIAEHLAKTQGFNLSGALEGGYSYDEVAKHLSGQEPSDWPRTIGGSLVAAASKLVGGTVGGVLERVGEYSEHKRQEIKDALATLQRKGAPKPITREEILPLREGASFPEYIERKVGVGIKKMGEAFHTFRETETQRKNAVTRARNLIYEAALGNETTPELRKQIIAIHRNEQPELALKKAAEILEGGRGFSEKTSLEKYIQEPIASWGRSVSGVARKITEKVSPVTESGTAKYYISGTIEGVLPSLGLGMVTTYLTKNPELGLASMAPYVYGQSYSESRKEGKTTTEASSKALVDAIAEVASEKIPLGIITKRGGKYVVRVLKAAPAEAITESINEALQIAYDEGVIGSDTPPEKIFQRLWEAGFMGGLGGGFAAGIYPHGEEVTKKDKKGKVKRKETETIIDPAAEETKKVGIATTLTDTIDTGLNTGKIGDQDFTREDAIALIQHGRKTGIYTNENVDAFKTKYPDLGGDLNSVIADSFKDKVTQTLQEEGTLPKGIEEAKIAEEKPSILAEVKAPLTKAITDLQAGIAKREQRLARNEKYKGTPTYQKWADVLEQEKAKLAELTGEKVGAELPKPAPKPPVMPPKPAEIPETTPSMAEEGIVEPGATSGDKQPWDNLTEEHFQKWLDNTIPDSERTKTEIGIKKLATKYPDLIARGDSWQEMRSLAERGGLIEAEVLKDYPELLKAAEVTPTKVRQRIYHFTKQENVQKILEEGFDTNLPPIHGTGALQKREFYTGEDKTGKDVLYFTTDKDRWNKATVYVGENKGTKDYSFYDYETQKWISEKKALAEIDLSPIEADIKEGANILIIDSYESYLAFQKKNIGDAFIKDRLNDVVNKAKELGYDILNIKHDPKKWEAPDGRVTRSGEKDWYKDATGGSGKNDFFVFNKNILSIQKDYPELKGAPLAVEVRKYKSAEDFIATFKKAYHGSETALSEFDITKPAKYVGFGTPNETLLARGYLYFSDKIKFAKEFGTVVNEAFISKDAKIFNPGEATEKELLDIFGEHGATQRGETGGIYNQVIDIVENPKTAPIIREKLKSHGYDGVYVDEGEQGVSVIRSTALLNPDKVKTKQQLIDIYNQIKGIKAESIKPAAEVKGETAKEREARIFKETQAKFAEEAASTETISKREARRKAETGLPKLYNDLSTWIESKNLKGKIGIKGNTEDWIAEQTGRTKAEWRKPERGPNMIKVRGTSLEELSQTGKFGDTENGEYLRQKLIEITRLRQGKPTVVGIEAAAMGKQPWEMTPEETAQAYVKANIKYGDGSWDISVVTNWSDNIRRTAKRLSEKWSSTKELVPKSRAGEMRWGDTNKALDFLRELGYGQIAWDREGNPYHARADMPLREGLYKEGNLPWEKEGKPETAEERAARVFKETEAKFAEEAASTETISEREARRKIEKVAEGKTGQKEAEVEAPRVATKGAINLLGRTLELGGVNLGDDYHAREMRQFPDLARVMRKTGASPDVRASELNDEGWKVGSGDDYVEILKSGRGREIFTPEKRDVRIERKLKKEAWDNAERELTRLETEGIDRGAIPESQERLKDVSLSEITAEAELNPEEITAAEKDVEDFFSEVTAEEPITETPEQARESFVADKITQAPSYQKLADAYRRFSKRLHGAGYNEVAFNEKITKEPWSLLTAHAGVMDSKSQAAKTLRDLADAVFKETGLPRKPPGQFRGMDNVDWNKVKIEKEETTEEGIKEGVIISYGSEEKADNFIRETARKTEQKYLKNHLPSQGLSDSIAEYKSRVAKEYGTQKRISYVGFKLTKGSEAYELADLFYIYRTPKQEILHAVYTAEDGTILAHNAITSGLIDRVTPGDIAKYIYRLNETAARLSASKIHLIHNHPGGNVTASEADKAFAGMMSKRFGKKAGENIIINGKEFNYFIPGYTQPIFWKSPYLTGKTQIFTEKETLLNVETVARFGQSLALHDDQCCLVYVNTQNEIQGWSVHEKGMLEKPVNELLKILRQQSGAHNASTTAIITADRVLIDRIVNQALKENIPLSPDVLDIVDAEGNSARKESVDLWRETKRGIDKKAKGLWEEGAPYKITEEDATYIKAVESGDIETAQKMVDEAAMRAGYRSGPFFHGSPNAPFSIYDPAHMGERTDAKSAKLGYFFSSNPDVAKTYQLTERERYRLMGGPLGGDLLSYEMALGREEASDVSAEYDTDEKGWIGKIRTSDQWGVEYTYDADNMVHDTKTEALDAADAIRQTEIDKAHRALDDAHARLSKLEVGKRADATLHRVFLKIDNLYTEDYQGGDFNDKPFSETIQEGYDDGADGILMKNVRDAVDNEIVSDVYVVPKNTQIKLADPVTYDDSGNVIPLSERFVETTSDIRYATGAEKSIPMPTLADVQIAFKGQEVTRLNNGNISIKFQGGYDLIIETVNHIEPDVIALQIGYGRGVLKEGEIIAEKYQSGTLQLVKNVAGKWELAHGSIHFLEDMGILSANEVSMLQRHINNLVKDGKFETANKEDIGGAEDRANFLADALTKEPKGFLGRIVLKIQDFVDKLVNAFGIKTVRGITRELKTGEIYGRGVKPSYNMATASLYSLQEKLKPFFSQLEKVTIAKMGGKMPVDQLRKMLKGNNVTDAEIENLIGGLEGIVTKQQVMDAIKENTTEFTDVMLGGGEATNNWRVENNGRGRWEIVNSDTGILIDTYGTQQEAEAAMLRGNNYRPDTKFDSVTSKGVEGGIPGTYRELTVTMPDAGLGGDQEMWIDSHGRETPMALEMPQGIAYEKAKADFIAKGGKIEFRKIAPWKDQHPEYASIANPVIRIHFDDRRVNGKRILFIREIQSIAKTKPAGMPQWAWDRAYDIGVKRILAYAKENGYDGVSWSTGQIVTDRYSLSKQVNSIDWGTVITGEGRRKEVTIATSDGLEYTAMVNAEGKVVSAHRGLGQAIGKSIDELVGKDMGKRIMEEQLGKVSGIALDVGGEGIKDVYDHRLPSLFKKYGKENVGEKTIDVGTKAEWLPEENRMEPPHPKITTVPFTPITEKTPASYPMYAIERKEPARTKEETAKWAEDFIRGITERVERERTDKEIARKRLTGEEAKSNREKARTTFEENSKVFDDDIRTTVKTFASAIKSVTKPKGVWNIKKSDLSIAGRFLATPLHSYEKVPTMWRMFGTAQEKVENQNIMLDRMTKDPVTGEYYTETLHRASKKSLRQITGELFGKEKSAKLREYKEYADYRVHQDKYQEGYGIRENEEGTFDIYETKTVIKRKYPAVPAHMVETFEKKVEGEGGFATDEKAGLRSLELELNDFRKKGFSEEMVNVLRADKIVVNNGFNILMQDIKDVIAYHEKRGLPLPTTVVRMEEGKVEIDLKAALNIMGDRRGYYFPRVRQSGQFMLTAKQEGLRPYLNFYDVALKNKTPEEQEKALAPDVSKGTKISAWREAFNSQTPLGKQMKKLRQEGFKVENISVSLSPRTTEDVFEMAGSTIALQEKINDALKNIDTVAEIDNLAMNAFAQSLAEQVANVEFGRGHRMHMIKRNPAYGEDVWRGYEEDPAIAISQYAAGIAGGEAKKQMALKLGRQFTGTDIGWAEFKELTQYENAYDAWHDDNPDSAVDEKTFWKYNNPEEFKTNEDRIALLKEEIKGLEKEEAKVKREELAEARNWLFKQYKKLVDERRIDNTEQKEAFRQGTEFIEDILRNPETSDRVMDTIKGIAVVKYLGGRVSAPVVNVTNLFAGVPPAMNMYGDIPLLKAGMYVAQGLNLNGQYRHGHTKTGAKLFGKVEDLSEEDKFVMDEINRRGWDKQQFNREALGALESKVGSGWRTTVEATMYAFGISEQINRAGTIMGTYRGIRRYKPDLNREEALKLAKYISDKAHSEYSKANRPSWIRGKGIFPKLAGAAYIFKNFSHNYLQNMKTAWGSGWTPDHAKAFTWLATAPAVLSGAGAFIGKEFVFGLASVLGIGGDDPEEEFYTFMGDFFGGIGERTARHGLFGLLGINLKGSLQIGLTDIPSTLPDLLGAPGSMLYDDPKYMYQATKRGETLKAIERVPVTPLFLANPLKGIRERTQGVTTFSNTPVFYGKERLMADDLDLLLRIFSFNPARLSGIREKQWSERKIQEKYRKFVTEFNARIKAYYLDPPEDRDPDVWADILADKEEYNRRIEASGALERGLASKITSKRIRIMKRQAFKPTKVERLREVEEEGEE